MPNEMNAALGSADQMQGTGEDVGELDERTDGNTGEPDAAQESNGEPSGEGLFDGMKPEDLHKSYKELQREYGKSREEMKDLKAAFDRMGGKDQVVQWFEYLSSNPNFAKFIEQERSRNNFGIDTDALDDEGKRALELITKIAENIAEDKVRAALRDKVDPLSETVKQQMIAEHFDQMDTKYPGWREFQDTMADLSETLPERKQQSPSFGDIEDLYWKAIRESGKMDDMAAKIYAKKMEAKKSKTTDKPTSTPAKGKAPKPKTIQDAWKQAKEESA